jgi:hypothetical protein
MSQSRVTLSAQVDSDTDLASQFEQYQQSNAMTSKSEAVRHLVRAGLEQELEHEDGADDPGSTASGSQTADADSTASPATVNVVSGNEAILLGVAFLIGSDGILASLQSVAGAAGGTLLFAALGLGIVLSMLPTLIRHLQHLMRSYSGGDDASDRGMGAD